MPPLNTQKQQQELFDEFVVVKKTRGKFFGVLNKFNKPIFPQHRLNLSVSYEVLIIALIGAVLVVSVIFSLGVERGRGLTGSEVAMTEPVQPAVMPIAVEPVVPPVAENLKPIQPATSVNAPVKATAPAASAKPYTIQVASYKGRDLADKELARLKGMGYSGEVVKKGDYFILCVGSFADKDSAKQTFAAMQKRYKSCLIRKR